MKPETAKNEAKPITSKEAKAAAKALQKRYQDQEWFTGVAVMEENGTRFLQVRVSPQMEVAKSFNGIPIRVVVQPKPTKPLA